jgi:NADH pyrophosphatase NudC (nudix superfamily)
MAQYCSGNVILDKNELEDYAWVAKDELKNYLSPDYLNSIHGLLF